MFSKSKHGLPTEAGGSERRIPPASLEMMKVDSSHNATLCRFPFFFTCPFLSDACAMPVGPG